MPAADTDRARAQHGGGAERETLGGARLGGGRSGPRPIEHPPDLEEAVLPPRREVMVATTELHGPYHPVMGGDILDEDQFREFLKGFSFYLHREDAGLGGPTHGCGSGDGTRVILEITIVFRI
jgi:hypothetical protein